MNAMMAFWVAVTLAAPPVETSPTAATRLYVRTVPPGASVELDGKPLGQADALFLVPAGTGRVSITMDGRAPEVREVSIPEGRITRIEVELRQVGANVPPTAGGAVPPVAKPLPDLPPRPLLPPLVEESPTEKALAAKMSGEFVDTPLEHAVEYLRSKNLNIVLDRKALESVGILPDTPVTCDLNGLPISSILDLLLGQLDLTWTIQDSLIEVTTPEEVATKLSTKVYDVSDLVGQFRRLPPERAAKTPGPNDPENAEPMEPLEEIGVMITVVLEPASWDPVGGLGSLQVDRAAGRESLVVSQSAPAHRRIAELLADLRLAMSQPEKSAPAVSHRGYWRQTPETQAIRKALDAAVSVDFVEAPLADVAEFLKMQTGVAVVLDAKSLTSVGIDPTQPVTAHLKDVALAKVLSIILKDLELEYAVDHDALMVTSSDSLSASAAVYPVGDLIADGRSAEDLVRLITSVISPNSWDALGGPGSIATLPETLSPKNQVLVISQTSAVHREIPALLGQLRRATAPATGAAIQK